MLITFNNSKVRGTLGVEDKAKKRLAKVFESHSKYQHTNLTVTIQYFWKL